MHEAAALQADLERAGIHPAAWIVDQSLAATGTTDPTLAARARHETRWLRQVLGLHPRMAVVAWQAEPPAGTAALESLVCSGREPTRVGTT